MPAFELWLEFEHWVPNEQDNLDNDFFNMHVILPDGKKYTLNVWTFKYLEQARCEVKDTGEYLGGKYLLPPDLFVERLDRKLLEEIFAELIKDGYMKDEWLVNESE